MRQKEGSTMQDISTKLDENTVISPIAVGVAEKLNIDASNRRLEEALWTLREKHVRSTTLERLRITYEATDG